MNQLPPAFVATVSSTFEDGAGWLARLPQTLAALAARWQLRLQPPFPNLSYNYVAPVLREDGSTAVLKVGVPRPELAREMAALRLYDGQGAVPLLRADPDQGALLLARLWPGTALAMLDDDERTTIIAAQVMRRLWHPLPADNPFRPVSEWTAGLQDLRDRFSGGTGPLPANLVDRAEGLFAELLATADRPVLLHGDFHHDNVLAHAEQWVAIDPKGVSGEPAFEVGALLHNPFGRVAAAHDLPGLLSRRVDLLAEHLSLDRRRLVAYGFAHAILASWWSLEDLGAPDAQMLRVARALQPLLEH